MARSDGEVFGPERKHPEIPGILQSVPVIARRQETCFPLPFSSTADRAFVA
jgi:hypothetical protein